MKRGKEILKLLEQMENKMADVLTREHFKRSVQQMLSKLDEQLVILKRLDERRIFTKIGDRLSFK